MGRYPQTLSRQHLNHIQQQIRQNHGFDIHDHCQILGKKWNINHLIQVKFPTKSKRYESERSFMKRDGPKGLTVDDLWNWTVPKSKSGRTWGARTGGHQSGRSLVMKVDGRKWTRCLHPWKQMLDFWQELYIQHATHFVRELLCQPMQHQVHSQNFSFY